MEHLPYDIARDFQPIALVTRGQLLLAVSPTTPFHSVKELIDYAKQNPGKLLNASSSNGSPGHVGGELFKFMTGTDIVHVPYKGGAPAINDLIAGRVQLMFESLNSIAPFARSGAVRALAVTRRSPVAGLSRFADHRRGRRARLFGADLERRHRAGRRAAADRRQAQCGDQQGHPVRRAFKARFAAIGDEPAGGTPEEFAALIASDSKKWGEVIKRARDQVRVTRPPTADFPSPRGLDPYCGHGAEAARSGKAFEERPGQADPRQGGAAGCAARSTIRLPTCSIPASARAPPGLGLADRGCSHRPTIPGTAAPISPMRIGRAPRWRAGSARRRSRAMSKAK